MKKILLTKDERTGIEYSEIIGRSSSRQIKTNDVLIRSVNLFDDNIGEYREQVVRLKVKLITNQTIQVVVF